MPHSVDFKQKYASQIITFRTWTHNVCREVTFNRGLVEVDQINVLPFVGLISCRKLEFSIVG